MLRRFISGIIVLLLVASVLTLCFEIHPVRSSGTIYIRMDGSIEGTTRIFTVDNVTYTFTDNINDSIVVERSNITIDGNGYTLQPLHPDPGDPAFQVDFVSNVTIKNTNIRNFVDAIYFRNTSGSRVTGNNINSIYEGITLLGESSNNTVSNNNITCEYGIALSWAFNNTISDNNITCNGPFGYCISLYDSQNNKISRNSMSATNETGIPVTPSRRGIVLWELSINNSLIMNNITHFEYGVMLNGGSGNVLRNNTMTENKYSFIVAGVAQCGPYAQFVNYVDPSNTIDGKPIYYLINKQDMTVPSDAAFVALVNCTRMIVQELTVSSHSKPGILLAWTTNSTITRNTLTRGGIQLYECSSNSISKNNMTTGMYVRNSFHHKIFDNNMNGSIYLRDSSENTVSGNAITGSGRSGGHGLELYGSSNNVLSGNNISECDAGIDLSRSSNNVLCGNFLTTNSWVGIFLVESSHNFIYENEIAQNNQSGILSEALSSNNTIFENNITNNDIGIRLAVSPNNTLYHNNFTNNTQQVDIYVSYGVNFWDNGSIGNYWSDYTERYPNATEIDGSGIWDTPYVIDENNQDNYPIVPEFSSLLLLPLFMTATSLAAILYKRKHAV